MRGVSKTHLGLGFVLNNGHDSPWTGYASLLPEKFFCCGSVPCHIRKWQTTGTTAPGQATPPCCQKNSFAAAVFHVTYENGKKLTDEGVIGYIEKTLTRNPCILPLFGKSAGAEVTAEHTAIELTGTDRPWLLSEIFAVLSDLRCNVVKAEVWTHNKRAACLVYVTDEDTGAPIEDRQKICKIEELLLTVMTGNGNTRGAKTVVLMGLTHTERRLHRLMFAGRDYEELHGTGGRAAPPLNGNGNGNGNGNARPLVAVDNCLERGYSVVTVQCKDRAKLLFDIVCTLTDMEYVVFHATIDSQGSQTFQEFYIRHTDGCPMNSEAERQRVILCLEAAIRRRASEGAEVPYTEVFGTFALAVGATVGMEYWARWAHRALWHASLWHMHESHHRPREGPFELNDVFAIINAGPAIALLAYGFFNKGLVPGLCFGAGLGITVFGMAYMFVHDGLVHRRFPVGPIADVPYLLKLHHADKFNGVPYGLFLGPKELEEVGGSDELEKLFNSKIKGLQKLQ